MSWFRKKGKYWYFIERIFDKEIQHYIGDDEAVKTKLVLFKALPLCKNLRGCEVDKAYCPFRNPKVNTSAMCHYYKIDNKLLPNKNNEQKTKIMNKKNKLVDKKIPGDQLQQLRRKISTA